ncbi:MAG: outer membrane beta-barrel protein [Candidatus Eisenbacteria bacterium]
MLKQWFTGSIAALVTILAVGEASAANTIILPRAGQVGVGIQGQYGTLLKQGDFGEEFGSGPGLAIRLRYRMRYERAFGLTFESQMLDARAPGRAQTAFTALEDSARRDRLAVNLAGLEFYQLFGSRTRTVKMVSAGVGLAQISARLDNGETQYPDKGDGVFVSLGAGVERFFYRSWAWDLSTRYHAIFHDGKTNHDIQGSLGIIFYAAY